MEEIRHGGELNGKSVFIADLEADGLLDTITKIHCLGYSYPTVNGWEVKSTTSHSDIKALFESDCYIVMHNGIQYDIPALNKIYPDIEIKATIIDSLCVSWAMYDHRQKHGLGDYGEEFGVPKPVVEDWEDQPIKVYINRVEEDCKINVKVWEKQFTLLNELYDSDEEIIKYLAYLGSLSELYVEQSQNPFTLDVVQAEENLQTLQSKIDRIVGILSKHMPQVPIKAIKNKPKKCYKADATVSTLGQKWFDFLDHCGLPQGHTEPVEYIKGYNDPNPQSVGQIKKWLFELGWVPCTFADTFNVDGDAKKVPQLKDKDKNLVPSILRMIQQYPFLKELEDLSIIQHRLGYVKGFLNKQVDGKIICSMGKFTASTRIAHRSPVVNLPGATSPYGEYVRSLLTCGEGKILYGSDISSLENYVAANYTWKYNPEILSQLNDPKFDSHITMAVFSGMMTQKEADWYKVHKKSKLPELQDEIERLYKIRYAAKTTNYSALFGIGPKKLANDLGIKFKDAKKLIQGFWKMNAHIQKFMDNDIPRITTNDARQWVQAPLTGFWLPCRADHKIFNIIIQSTGSYIHNLWMHFMRKKGYLITLSMHDEFVLILPDDIDREKIALDATDSMNIINDLFNFAAPISVDGSFGKTYADIH